METSYRLAHVLTGGRAELSVEERQLVGVWKAIDDLAVALSELWAGRHQEAEDRFRMAEVSSRIAGDRLALVHALAGSALAAALTGDADAVAAADEAIAVTDQLAPQSRWVAANAHLAFALIHQAVGSDHAMHGAAFRVLRSLSKVSEHVEPHTRSRAEDLINLHPDRGESEAVAHAQPTISRTSGLSDRERRVLRSLCGPLTLREIAAELYVSHNTVKSQVSSIFRKLDVHDRAAAIAVARSRSLVKQ
ncbi:LuxR C-terminal-related transcriptional regulator [Streptomyces sp. NPDC005708]|uniref:helix-turn-helix transcriptional regulator n=1 Tax=Streptomyces sp. NPDC005708 TaxID=3154564 RepID=UPI0033DA9F13